MSVVVDGTGFMKLMNFLEPGYTVPYMLQLSVSKSLDISNISQLSILLNYGRC